MKPLSALIFAGALILAACRDHPTTISLTRSSMFSIDTVRLAAAGGDEKAAAGKLKEATDLYRKKGSDTTHCIELFENSILLKPTAKAYFELSGALLATRQDSEAIQALRLAERLGYTPLANVMFRYSYAYSHWSSERGDSNAMSALHYMELALQMEYARPQDFLRRETFANLNQIYAFATAFNDVLGGMAGRDPQKSLWESYSTQFPDVPLPLTVNLQWIKSHPLQDDISFEFQKFIPEMRDGKFDRGGGMMYYYVALIRKSPEFTAVVYGQQYEDDEEDAEANATANADSTRQIVDEQTTVATVFSLVTYDREGKIVDRLRVAGRDADETSLKAFAIQPNLQFQVQYMPDKSDSTAVAIAPDHYRIDATGKFVKTDAPLAAR